MNNDIRTPRLIYMCVCVCVCAEREITKIPLTI